MNKGLIITPTVFEIEAARVVGRLRKERNDGTRKPGADQGAKNTRSDCFGALAEILVLNRLCALGITPQAFVLLADRPAPGPDLAIGGVTYNVKSLPPALDGEAPRLFLTINEGKRLTHPPEFYLPVCFALGKTGLRAHVLSPITPEAVGHWQLRSKPGREDDPYRSAHIATLEPLRAWADLPGVWEDAA